MIEQLVVAALVIGALVWMVLRMRAKKPDTGCAGGCAHCTCHSAAVEEPAKKGHA